MKKRKYRETTYCHEDGNDGDSVFSARSFFVVVIQIFIPMHQMQLRIAQQHVILPHRSDFNYNLRPRRHNLVLTAKGSSITDRDYITKMTFKNIY